ncbi:diguanylate cyclase [Aureimonas sp. Leaf454]|uniref:GGDEF domain-containing protein n=1 Tax=Aureimonas sp. Leaf454 TaxID=1736381 RepID=UPI0006FB6731|nr:GGDEF domain-containing protein [Aureimonas sp. Leaf454]KQT47459.1 diguanylate cyclase [Aureimonas sp. Leaf454]
MQIDIPTLYLLTVGTLCVGAAMTVWERSAQVRRSRELGIWACGYLVLAIGCVIMMQRARFPGIWGPTLTNVVMVTGYLTLLHGIWRLDGKTGRWLPSLLIVAAVGSAWLLLGSRFTGLLWNYVSSIPVALVSGGMAIALARSRTVRGLRSRPVAIAISAIHALFYIGRAVALPVLVSVYGPDVLTIAARITMIEAVLYSVAMPMAFLALVREESQGDLLKVSQTDYLTGLGNRHAFFERGGVVLGEHRDRRPVTLLAFDLDHFKAINDRHGHAVGDEVLKLFARIARDEVGVNAVLARLGGEEFAALLPGISAIGARGLAERLCRRFADTAARPDGLGLCATVSIGLVEATGDGRALPELLSAADRALYTAKSLGRNRVEFAPPVAAAA